MPKKGYKQTIGHSQKIGLANSIALKGREFSEEHKKHIREGCMGNKNSLGIKRTEEFKRRRRELMIGNKSRKGMKNSKEMNEKIRQSRLGKTGKLASNWQGGKSFEPYGLEFNETLKEQIRERDNYRCQECFRHQDELFTKSGKRYKLMIHHIDYDKQNNKPENLISLCRNCHLQTNFQREDWTNYFNKIPKPQE
ncbi:HNH endonuclease [Candidatus Babeliales bacterium]|nr:HNH endonuclease [Candidatus Babeliales bacterium]